MNIQTFLDQLNTSENSISFTDTMSVIDANYEFTPCEFTNGSLTNAANQNNGSCKIFAFAKLHNLAESLTLQCFGDYYRKDVLEHPEADDHQNIRNFMHTGWSGITFNAPALKVK